MAKEKKYKKKPPEVYSLQYLGNNVADILAFCPMASYANGVLTLNNMEVPVNYWVVKDAAGIYYAERPEFLSYYDEAPPT